MLLIRRALMCLAVLAFAGQTVLAAESDISPDTAFLKGLEGDWIMSGTFAGKPVQYRAKGESVLQSGFVRLHMIDTAPTPMYEADVYLGFDARQNDYILHWLDRFGAAGARVVGTGRRKGSILTVIIPYRENNFRDSFEWHEQTRSWDLIIESQNNDGTWSLFVHYKMIRP